MSKKQGKVNELNDLPNMSLDRLRQYQIVLRGLCLLFTMLGSCAISGIFFIWLYTEASHIFWTAGLIFISIFSFAFFIPAFHVLGDIKMWIKFRTMFSNTSRDIKEEQ